MQSFSNSICLFSNPAPEFVTFKNNNNNRYSPGGESKETANRPGILAGKKLTKPKLKSTGYYCN